MPAHVRTVEVPEADRRELERRVRDKGAPARVVERARIVLLAADEMPGTKIATMVGCDESNFRPPVATKASMPFTDNCMAYTFCEIRSAWPRSSMISEADSMPIDSRTSSSPISAALS